MVNIISGDLEVGRTKLVHTSQNPIWNEKFDILIYDKATQQIKLHVVDKSGTELGFCNFDMNAVPWDEIIEKRFDLKGGMSQGQNKGSICVRLYYRNVKKHNGDDEEMSPRGNESFLLDPMFESLQEDVMADLEKIYQMGRKNDGLRSFHSGKLSRSPISSPRAHYHGDLSSSSKYSQGLFTIKNISCRGLR